MNAWNLWNTKDGGIWWRADWRGWCTELVPVAPWQVIRGEVRRGPGVESWVSIIRTGVPCSLGYPGITPGCQNYVAERIFGVFINWGMNWCLIIPKWNWGMECIFLFWWCFVPRLALLSIDVFKVTFIAHSDKWQAILAYVPHNERVCEYSSGERMEIRKLFVVLQR